MFWQKAKKAYFDYFEEHAKLSFNAAKELQNIFETVSSTQEAAKKIKHCEHLGDNVAHQAFTQMNTSGFILPLDREDIYLMIKTLDDVLDLIDDAAESYTEIYELKETTPYAQKLSKGILEGCKIVLENCHLIRKPKKNEKQILDNSIKLHRIENEADDIKKMALRELFQQLKSGDIGYAEFVAWNEMYHTLESITDAIEDCADVAEQFVMKYS